MLKRSPSGRQNRRESEPASHTEPLGQLPVTRQLVTQREIPLAGPVQMPCAQNSVLAEQLSKSCRTGCIEVIAGQAGQDQVSAAALLKDFDAVFLGLGLGADSKLNLPEEKGPGVYGAVDLIEKIKADPDLKLTEVRRALVIGGGNTAIDIAHELKLLGVADVAMVYRRGVDAMSGYVHELASARKHGVRMLEHHVVTAFVRDGDTLTGVKLARAENGKAVAGAEEFVSCELVALAIGQATATSMAKGFPGVMLDPKGNITVDPKTQRTGNPKVWSAGDCVNGGKEVVNAVQEAKIAVRDMLRALGAK